MKYIVIKPFQDITGFKLPGEPIELDNDRAAKLRTNGLIGGKYEENQLAEPIEKAIPKKKLSNTKKVK